jgi:hypothetical protein
MTLQEFSLEFDLLYNNISSNQAPGLTEYEKSVFLTQAQEALILDFYKGTAGDSFETTEEVTRYLNSLIREPYAVFSKTFIKPFTKGVSVYELDLNEYKDLLFILFYRGSVMKDSDSRDVLIKPTTQDKLYKEINNPFKGPNENRVLVTSENNKLKFYTKYPLNSIWIKYLSKPNPIILTDLASEEEVEEGLDYLTIDGKYKAEEVDWIPESLHRIILLKAVQAAKLVWKS